MLRDPIDQQADPNLLHPFPEGWYFVASRRSLLKDKLIQKTWMGKKIVAWCDEEGNICVAEAVCPHLGADLGPAAGGMVRDSRLVCPFHGFEFDVGGQCVATPFSPPPKAAGLRVFETRAVLDLVFAWWGNNGRPPQWDLPEDPPAGPEWSEMGYKTLCFPGHPQETTENAVDLAHLRYVHGYGNVSRVGPLSVEGAFIESSFNFKRTRKIAGVADLVFDVTAVTRVFGLGYSQVNIQEHTIAMNSRLWVLATPVDGRFIDLVLAGQVREIRRPKRAIVGLRFVPTNLRAGIMNRIMLAIQKQEVLQDVVIWGNKRYRARPRLCRSDGEIGRYRRYCQQFYPGHGGAGRDRHEPPSMESQ